MSESETTALARDEHIRCRNPPIGVALHVKAHGYAFLHRLAPVLHSYYVDQARVRSKGEQAMQVLVYKGPKSIQLGDREEPAQKVSTPEHVRVTLKVMYGFKKAIITKVPPNQPVNGNLYKKAC